MENLEITRGPPNNYEGQVGGHDRGQKSAAKKELGHENDGLLPPILIGNQSSEKSAKCKTSKEDHFPMMAKYLCWQTNSHSMIIVDCQKD